MDARKFLRTVFFSAAIAMVPAMGIVSSAQASLQGQMNKLFGDMTNVTNPGSYKTQSRGVLTGGRITQKSKIFNENLVSFSAPSWKAGCGGIDFYGGSLSFINKDQIVQLLRAIAANAKGYFFQLALANACPDCATWIETFQKKIQQLNQFFGNSCQLAQGLVNDLTDGTALASKDQNKASLMGTARGFYDGIFDAKNESQSPSKKLADNSPDDAEEEGLFGNVVWVQLRKNNVDGWFGNTNKEMSEAIMSLTGSVIVGKPESDGQGDDAKNVYYLSGNQITLEGIIEGGSQDIYDCGAYLDSCLGDNGDGVLGTKNINLTGLRKMVDDLLLGDAGLIEKYVNHRDHGGLSVEQISFLETLPSGVGGIIAQLSRLDKEAAKVFTQQASAIIALNIAYDLSNGMFKAAHASLSNSKSTYKSEAERRLRDSETEMRKEYAVLTARHGTLASLIEQNNIIIENIRRVQYLSGASYRK